MKKKSSSRITKSFGPRYGFKLRRKYGEVVLRYKTKKYECPNCGKKTKMKKVSLGIWKCPKCNFTFAGEAYNPEV